MYESTIDFTLDTICPWTYLAKKRLDEALRLIREKGSTSDITFTINYLPYQLYPDITLTGEDKYEWYKKSKYGDSEEKMKMYTTLMTAYGLTAGINYKFKGTVANTLPAHRIIQYFQEKEGRAVADKLVGALYRMYFEEERHPSCFETLRDACEEAGIPPEISTPIINSSTLYLHETKALIQEQASNGIDSVPVVVIEGRKRDITVNGANEVGDYCKALEKVWKECL